MSTPQGVSASMLDKVYGNNPFDHIDTFFKTEEARKQQALENKRADAQLKIQQDAALAAKNAIDKKNKQDDALLYAAQNTRKSTMDEALASRINEAYETDKEGFYKAYGLDANGDGKGDLGNQTDFSKFLQNQLTTADDKVTDVHDYMQRFSKLAVDKGADPLIADQAAKARGALIAPVGASKDVSKNSEARYKLEIDAIKDKQNNLDTNFKSFGKSSKTADSRPGSYDNIEDKTKLIEGLKTKFGKEPWFSGLGGDKLTKAVDSLMAANYHPNDIMYAAVATGTGKDNAWLAFDGSVPEGPFTEILQREHDKRQERKAKGLKSQSIRDMYNDRTAELQKARDLADSRRLAELGNVGATHITDNERADAVMRKAFEIAGKQPDNLEAVEKGTAGSNTTNQIGSTGGGPDVPLPTRSSEVSDFIKTREGVLPSVSEDGVDAKGNKLYSAGHGHQLSPEELKKYPPGTKIPQTQIDTWFKEDSDRVLNKTAEQAEEIGISKNSPIGLALNSLNFQLGVNWADEHPKMFKAIKEGNYDAIVKEASSSKWNKQTPVRVNDLIRAVEAQKSLNARPLQGPLSKADSKIIQEDLTKSSTTNKDPEVMSPQELLFAIAGKEYDDSGTVNNSDEYKTQLKMYNQPQKLKGLSDDELLQIIEVQTDRRPAGTRTSELAKKELELRKKNKGPYPHKSTEEIEALKRMMQSTQNRINSY